MEEVIKQAPSHLDEQTITVIFQKNNNDVLKTLMELWNIVDESKKEKNKWDDIRDTCDEFDTEMQKMLKRCRTT